MSPLVNFITGAIGLALMMIFTIGLSQSVSAGFAGFWGGLPLAIIVGLVILLAAINFWQETIRRK